MGAGSIGIIHRTVSWPQFWTSLNRLQKPKGAPCYVINVEGTSMHKQRNQVVAEAMRLGCDWLLFCDDDHVTPPDFLQRLLAWNVPFVGGLYFTRTPPHHTTCLRENKVWTKSENRFTTLDKHEFCGTGLAPVDVLGMGFTLIRREVFEAVCPFDPQKIDRDNPPSWFEMQDFGTDDVAFCVKARDAGYQPHVDLSMVVPHLALKAVVWNGQNLQICDPQLSVDIANQYHGVEVVPPVVTELVPA